MTYKKRLQSNFETLRITERFIGKYQSKSRRKVISRFVTFPTWQVLFSRKSQYLVGKLCFEDGTIVRQHLTELQKCATDNGKAVVSIESIYWWKQLQEQSIEIMLDLHLCRLQSSKELKKNTALKSHRNLLVDIV